MYDVLLLLLGWVLGIFTWRILNPVFRLLVTAWLLVTKPKEDRGSRRFEIEKNWFLDQIRQCLTGNR